MLMMIGEKLAMNLTPPKRSTKHSTTNKEISLKKFFFIKPVTETEIETTIANLKNKKITGKDDIQVETIEEIKQFVWNDFREEYIPTDTKHTYYPSVITNDRLYEIKISDIPVIPYFPVNSYYEWTNYRYYGLRSSTAYILVFDLSNIETFQYIKTLREQICESRNMANVPILVVGNKQDQVTSEEGHGSGKMAITNCIEEKRRDIVNLVKKHWKSGYIECSAKYNWKVIAVFKELINMIDHLDSRDQSPMLDNIQEALDRNKCVIL
ncbi:hypothetical protein WA026_019643 [Henosepilachna vigintioctopunctata]|uniref:Uncharacterized protein n=1 Tax=Henosepilachna vigintioctopunctata TaxID=420089 RepID=A0AAW1TPV4_9CUCU